MGRSLWCCAKGPLVITALLLRPRPPWRGDYDITISEAESKAAPLPELLTLPVLGFGAAFE